MSSIAVEANQFPEARNNSMFYLTAVVVSSLFIITGLIWDISWHMSIGRDGLFSAPHLAIYLGGVVAGLLSGYEVLRVTLAGTPVERSKCVKFWGIFYGSLGNLFCIWGAIAMLTSAPFDDWWHNAYGLDVTILSPPHTILLLGMIMIQFGAIVSVLSYQNINSTPLTKSGRWFTTLVAMSTGFVLVMTFTMASEYLGRHEMHRLLFYQICSVLFPLLLVAFSVSSRSKWGATYATIVYSLFLMIMNWILPLFPATPKLGPVLNPITTFQPFEFPLLIFFPALLIDLITNKYRNTNAWIRAAGYAIAFVVVFMIVQWPFASLLMASKGHWFFGTSRWYFGSDPTWEYRFAFGPWMNASLGDIAVGVPLALALAYISSRIGITWGTWMKKIVR